MLESRAVGSTMTPDRSSCDGQRTTPVSAYEAGTAMGTVASTAGLSALGSRSIGVGAEAEVTGDDDSVLEFDATHRREQRKGRHGSPPDTATSSNLDRVRTGTFPCLTQRRRRVFGRVRQSEVTPPRPAIRRAVRFGVTAPGDRPRSSGQAHCRAACVTSCRGCVAH